MKSVDVNQAHILSLVRKLMTKLLNLKLVILLEYQNIKIFAKNYSPNCSEQVFLIKIVKNTVWLAYVINGLNREEIVGTFYEKELPKKNQKEFRIERVIKKKGDKLYFKWKGYNSLFNSWIFSKRKIYKSKCNSWIRFI